MVDMMTTEELRGMLASDGVRITLPMTFTHGRCVQVAVGKVKSPVIVPNMGESVADVLRMLAGLLEDVEE